MKLPPKAPWILVAVLLLWNFMSINPTEAQVGYASTDELTTAIRKCLQNPDDSSATDKAKMAILNYRRGVATSDAQITLLIARELLQEIKKNK